MINFRIKIDDKDIYKALKKQKATLEVGFWGDIYEEIDEGFYAPYGPQSNITNKARRYSPRKAISVATVAAANEFGGKNRPPRPFMRTTVKKNRKKWRNFVQEVLPQYANNINGMMEKLGEIAVEDMTEMIRIWSKPPNAPSTIRRKGFNDPLIDSGQMMDSVRMQIK